MISNRLVTGFAVAVAALVGSLALACAEPLRPNPAPVVAPFAAPNGLPALRCSRPAEQEALRINRLVETLNAARAAAERNPLLYADVGYYEAELAASRRCLPAAVATR